MAAPASASTTLVLPDGTERPQPYQGWIDRSHVPTPDATITLHLAPCPDGSGALGCTVPGEIYLDDRDRFVLLHEVGHLVDLGATTWDGTEGLRPWQRRKLAAALRIRRWREELVADAYATCATVTRIRGLQDYSQYKPTARQHRRVCHLIRRTAIR